ncbi:MAG TPA: hypothetical protein PK651_11400 [Smithellaceae bacterium]|jgi:hypothetical protein|nr:hypothetical protein [Smithellaceae bacterium]
MKRLLPFFIIGILIVTGCRSIPKDALSLSPESLAQRQIQTRKYETKDEAKILASCAGLLQDMGFNLDESETKLGVITASKTRSAVSAGNIAAAILLSALSRVPQPTDKEQKMRASVITRPIGQNDEHIAVRVTFQRIVWNTQGEVTKTESIDEPKIYQEFFDKLSKSIFLEAHAI